MHRYRRDDMRQDVAARGWHLTDWFIVARVNRWTAYDFMRGKTNSPRIAEALTRALGQKPGYYLIRRRKAA